MKTEDRVKVADIARASASWAKAGKELGIRVIAPFDLEQGEHSVRCIAFLPDFGGENGMVIGAILGPRFDTDNRLPQLAGAKGLFWSCINPVPFGRSNLDRRLFTEALEDWGYFGPPDACPSWYRGYNYGVVVKYRHELRQNWAHASKSLSFRIALTLPPLTEHTNFIAHVPDFGSSRGTVLAATYPPKFDQHPAIERFARNERMFCAQLDATAYREYEESKFAKTLAAWRYYGPHDRKPSWA